VFVEPRSDETHTADADHRCVWVLGTLIESSEDCLTQRDGCADGAVREEQHKERVVVGRGGRHGLEDLLERGTLEN